VSLPDGVRDQAIRVPLAKLRDLGMLPLDVEIVRVLPEPNEVHGVWYMPAPAEKRYVYLHVRGRVCWRTAPGCMLPVEELDDFLTRHWQLAGLTGEA
jgi:hypothetical protein